MKNLFLAAGLVLLAACSKNQDVNAPTQMETGEKYPIEFTTPLTETKAATPSYGNLAMASNIRLSVFAQDSDEASFLNCNYFVSEKSGGTIGLSYNNSVEPENEKQKIVELSAGSYDIYAAGVNDGGLSDLTPAVAASESGSYYSVSHGKEYIRAEIKGQEITDQAATRTVRMSFTREVAMLKFTLVSGSGVTLPQTTTPGLISDMKISLPMTNQANEVEGKMFVQTGIASLTGSMGALRADVMKSSAENESPCIYAYVLPCNLGAVGASYAVHFTLDIDGSPRNFELNNIPMPTETGTNNSVFAKGSQYNYTVTVNNTGLYLSEVQVADWMNVDQGGLTAE